MNNVLLLSAILLVEINLNSYANFGNKQEQRLLLPLSLGIELAC
jgi:hypothetical protein